MCRVHPSNYLLLKVLRNGVATVPTVAARSLPRRGASVSLSALPLLIGALVDLHLLTSHWRC